MRRSKGEWHSRMKREASRWGGTEETGRRPAPPEALVDSGEEELRMCFTACWTPHSPDEALPEIRATGGEPRMACDAGERRSMEVRAVVTAAGVKSLRLPPPPDGLPSGLKYDARIKGGKELAGHDLALRVAAYLRRFLEGEEPEESIPVDLSGKSGFATRVLDLACSIPWGETRSYRWLAERLGAPGAARAVGGALAWNQVPLLLPCHRVVRSDGRPGGFSAGAEWKRLLLRLEAEGGASGGRGW